MASKVSPQKSTSVLHCLVPHVASQIEPGSLITIMHVANSFYLRFLHDLIVHLAVNEYHVHVLDFYRNIKSLYLQHALRRKGRSENLKRIQLRIVLSGEHALNVYRRLHQETKSQDTLNAVFLVNPSKLFGRLRGSVKQAASTLQFQYEIIEVLASEGYAIVVTDAGGREYHRTESLVPAQLAQPSKLILQFLPQRIQISKSTGDLR